ncbi:MAG: alpha/beta fold hydrolase [Acidobacteriaceae bacterium]
MTETIETRELFALEGPEGIIRGTYHKACDERSCGVQSSVDPDRIGLLFLGGLSATRASNGDSAVYWADVFAQRGYPSVRLDLPGFGDSDGNPPTEALEYVNAGGYASILSSAIEQLVAQFNLAGVVIVGHCTGTVSAIYAAAASGTCRGLVLMDPLFFLPPTKLSKFRRDLHTWILRFHLDKLLTQLYDRTKEALLLLRRKAAPSNANLPLLRCWKKLTATGLPILILKASGRKTASTKTRMGEFDYVEYVVELAARKSDISVHVAEGAHHSFANRLGRAAVQQHTEAWLSMHFPITERESSGTVFTHPETVFATNLSPEMPVVFERLESVDIP